MAAAARWLLAVVCCAPLTACFDSPPQVIALTPSRGSVGVPADTPIEVQFDRPVIPASVAGRFTVSPGIPGCELDAAFRAPPGGACRIVWASGDSVFVLQHPGAILAPDTQYTFTLRGGFRDPQGAVNTVDHSWFLTTAGAPQVRATNPPEGAVAVAVDSPITIDFNTGMNPLTTEAAIRLSPDVAGTRVIANAKDKSRFMLVPGELLDSGVAYRLSVAATATDEHGQPLAQPFDSSFTTGGMAPGGHAVVLARRPGEAPTEVVITALAAVEDGLPIAGETALTAPRCPGPAPCGAAAAGAPLFTFTSAVLSPDNQWIAVVEQDRTTAPAPDVLVVVNAATGALLTSIAGGAQPAWSPDGATLAYTDAGSVSEYRPADGATVHLPPGDPVVAAPVWSPAGELIALDAQGTGGEHVDLGDALVAARYPVPGLTGNATDPVISPDGSLLAVERYGDAQAGAWLVGVGVNAASPRRLDPNLVPLGFADSGTLVALAVTRGGAVSLVRVSVAGDVQVTIPTPPGAFDIPAVVVSPSGRQLAYLASANGATNAFVANADGSDPVALTQYSSGSLEAASVSLNG